MQTIDAEDPKQSKGFPSCYSASGDLQIWALVLRCLLVFSTLIMGVFIPHFALLMGLTGSFTGTSLAFLLPCAFHIKLKWHEMKWRHIAVDVFIFLGGLLCASLGIYYSILGLYEIYNPPVVMDSANLLSGNRSYVAPEWFPEFPNRNDYDSDFNVMSVGGVQLPGSVVGSLGTTPSVLEIFGAVATGNVTR